MKAFWGARNAVRSKRPEIHGVSAVHEIRTLLAVELLNNFLVESVTIERKNRSNSAQIFPPVM